MRSLVLEERGDMGGTTEFLWCWDESEGIVE